MTQDIVERYYLDTLEMEMVKRVDGEWVCYSEAAQTIAALRAELDEARKEIERWHNVAMKAGAITHSDGWHSYPLRTRAEAAEAKVKELEEGRAYDTAR
jgi:hypothetical protein